jgi:hypothetical protein
MGFEELRGLNGLIGGEEDVAAAGAGGEVGENVIVLRGGQLLSRESGELLGVWMES